MRVIVCCPIKEFSDAYCQAASTAGMEADEESNPQEFGSQLYRDPEAMGLLWASGPTSAAMTVVKMREGQIKSRLIVLIEQRGPLNVFKAGVASVLTAGADDVQPAEIELRELSARLKAIARRGPYFEHQFFEMAGGKYFSDRCVFYGPVESVHLSSCESRLLVELARNQDRTLTKEELITGVYGYDEDTPLAKIIDVYVCKIRRKIAIATGGLDVIETVWGRGYQFIPSGFKPVMSMSRHRMRA